MRPANLLKGDFNSYFPVNITKFLRKACSVERSVAASGIETFFWFETHTNLKIYEDSMTQI